MVPRGDGEGVARGEGEALGLSTAEAEDEAETVGMMQRPPMNCEPALHAARVEEVKQAALRSLEGSKLEEPAVLPA